MGLIMKKTVHLWDVATGEHKDTLTGHTDRVVTVAFSPDGKTLASGASWKDNTIRLWDAATGQHQRTFTGHTDGVESVAFSPDGRTLASGSADGTVLLWEIAPYPVVSSGIAGDVNQDGVVDIFDLVLVGSNFGQRGQSDADVNGDGLVDVIDLVLVSGAISDAE